MKHKLLLILAAMGNLYANPPQITNPYKHFPTFERCIKNRDHINELILEAGISGVFGSPHPYPPSNGRLMVHRAIEGCILVELHIVSPIPLPAVEGYTVEKFSEEMCTALDFVTETHKEPFDFRKIVAAATNVLRTKSAETMVSESNHHDSEAPSTDSPSFFD